MPKIKCRWRKGIIYPNFTRTFTTCASEYWVRNHFGYVQKEWCEVRWAAYTTYKRFVEAVANIEESPCYAVSATLQDLFVLDWVESLTQAHPDILYLVLYWDKKVFAWYDIARILEDP